MSDWRDAALCAQTSPDLFFPTLQQQTTAQAKKICGECTVKAECVEYALANNEDIGVWGQLDPHERRELKRRRALDELAA